MKKFKLTFVAVLAFVIGLFCFASCGAKSYAGTYKFESMSMGTTGMSMEIKAGEKYMGMTLTEDFAVLELKEDGSMTLKMMGEETGTGTWKNAEEKGKIILTVEETPRFPFHFYFEKYF